MPETLTTKSYQVPLTFSSTLSYSRINYDAVWIWKSVLSNVVNDMEVYKYWVKKVIFFCCLLLSLTLTLESHSHISLTLPSFIVYFIHKKVKKKFRKKKYYYYISLSIEKIIFFSLFMFLNDLLCLQSWAVPAVAVTADVDIKIWSRWDQKLENEKKRKKISTKQRKIYRKKWAVFFSSSFINKTYDLYFHKSIQSFFFFSSRWRMRRKKPTMQIKDDHKRKMSAIHVVCLKLNFLYSTSVRSTI